MPEVALDRAGIVPIPGQVVAGRTTQHVRMRLKRELGLANRPAQIELWEKAVRIQAMLATRLRLAPQSRMTPKTAARLSPGYYGPAGPRSWEI